MVVERKFSAPKFNATISIIEKPSIAQFCY